MSYANGSQLPSYFLTLKDIEKMQKPLPTDLDNETKNYLTNFRKKLHEQRLDKINKSYFDLCNIWPLGKPIEFFIGLELCNDDLSSLKEKLMLDEFKKTLQREARERGYSSTERLRKPSIENDNSGYIDENLDYSEGETPENHYGQIKRRKSPRTFWDLADRERFLAEYYRELPLEDMSSFSKKFPGKTEQDCINLFRRLRKEKKIPADHRLSSEVRKKLFGDIFKLAFKYKNRVERVGVFSIEEEKNIMYNPIPGYIDMITQKPIERPALSPDGYCLDYSTWVKLINEKKVNPFTQNQVTNKRQLVILTIDNFEEYKNKIKNLEQMAPVKA